MFSNISRKTIDLILELTSYNSAKTVEILGGIKPHNVLEQPSQHLLKKGSITFSVNDQSAVGDAIAYYKKRNADLTHPLRIKYSAGLDAGGLSRKFYSDVMLHIKDEMNAFEGPVATCLIPAHSSSVRHPEDFRTDSRALSTAGRAWLPFLSTICVQTQHNRKH